MKQGSDAGSTQTHSPESITLDLAELRCSSCGVTAETPLARPFQTIRMNGRRILRSRLCSPVDVAPADWKSRLIGDVLERCGLGRTTR